MVGGRRKDGAENGGRASGGWSNCDKKIRRFDGQTAADRLLQNEKTFGKINIVTWAKRHPAADTNGGT